MKSEKTVDDDENDLDLSTGVIKDDDGRDARSPKNKEDSNE
jgi:hypothetical protein